MKNKDQESITEAYLKIFLKENENSVDSTKQIKIIIEQTMKDLGNLTYSSDDPILKEKSTTIYKILQDWVNLNFYTVADNSPSRVTKQAADMYEYLEKQK